MKILQINNNHRIIGGSDTVYMQSGQLLEAHGHQIAYFAGRHPKDELAENYNFFPDAIIPSERRILDLPRYFHNRAAARAIRELLQHTGPWDLANLHIYYGRLTASILPELSRCGVPIVQTLHEYKLACPIYTLERAGAVCEECIKGSTLNCLRHRCKGGSLLSSAIVFAEFWASRMHGDVRLIDKFICVSDFQRSLLERAGIPPGKMTTIHNFVDPEEFYPRRPRNRQDYILYFGRIEKLKGLATLIDAVRQTDMNLCIAGTGNWTEELNASIKDLSQIRYLGFVTGAPLKKLIQQARAVIVPSEWYENCPMSVLEAKAAGTPVIGAKIGGIPELIRDGIDGFLFQAGDSESLAEALSKLKNIDPDCFGSAAIADVQRRFSPDVHLRNLVSLYEEVIAGRQSKKSP